MAFGFEKMATFEQVAKVLSAFGYDVIEVGGFFDHVTVERFPDKASRAKLRSSSPATMSTTTDIASSAMTSSRRR